MATPPPPTAHYVEPITLRFPETRTSQSEPGTRRFIEVTSASEHYQAGQLLAERYRIIKGPLGPQSGEAELYLVQDELRHSEVACKLYHAHKKPKMAVLQQLQDVTHPYLLRILDHGTWQGRFFEVMPYCQGGSLSERLPLTETALRELLPQLIEALRFCHENGIIHRDIKPSNLLFNDNNEIQLADFGISSYLESDSGVTRTAGNLTLDYAAPELIEGHQIGPYSDYYALGITLLHALLGRSPFAGFSHNDLIIAHLRGQRSIPEHLSPSFRQLIFGLTLNNSQHRWGYHEVQDWLAGHEVAIIPDRLIDAQGTKIQSYPGWPAAHTPQQLGLDLARFDAINHLLRGDIRRWLFDHFGSALSERVDEIRQNYGHRPAVALHYLRFVLAPKSPLVIAGQEITHLEALLELLAKGFQNPVIESALHTALQEEQVRAWILATKPAGADSANLVDLIDALQKRQASRISTIHFALYYLLDPTRPLLLSPKIAIQQPYEIGPALVQNPKVIFRAWWNLLNTQCLDEWLRAIRWQPLDETLAFLKDVRYLFIEYPNTQTYAVLWRFAPDLPFFLDKKGFNYPEQLAQAVDQHPELKNKFIKILQNGQLLAWLMGSGRLKDSTLLRQFLMNAELSWLVRMEQVLQLLHPQRHGPRLITDKSHIDLGTVLPDKLLPSTTLTLSNKGGGYLFGSIGWGDQITGIELSRYKFEANHCVITLTLQIPDWESGTHNYQLQITSNGGTLNLPVFYFVPQLSVQKSWLELLAGWIAPLRHLNMTRIIIVLGMIWFLVDLFNDYRNDLKQQQYLQQFHNRFERLSADQTPISFGSEGECFIDHQYKRLWRLVPGRYNIKDIPNAVAKTNTSEICQHLDWRRPTDFELEQLAEGLFSKDSAKLVPRVPYWGEETLIFYFAGNGVWEQYETINNNYLNNSSFALLLTTD